MGLDMNLTRRTMIYANWEQPNSVKCIVTINNKDIPIDSNAVSAIVEQCTYWRKANAIHKWFVQNVQDGNDDCGDYYVDDDKLRELLQVCKEVMTYKEAVLAGNEDARATVEELLPTQEGFFFGITTYAEHYFEDVEYTIDELLKILKENKERSEISKQPIYMYYHSSW